MPWGYVMIGLTGVWVAGLVLGQRLYGPRLRWLWLATPLVLAGWWWAMIDACGRTTCP